MPHRSGPPRAERLDDQRNSAAVVRRTRLAVESVCGGNEVGAKSFQVRGVRVLPNMTCRAVFGIIPHFSFVPESDQLPSPPSPPPAPHALSSTPSPTDKQTDKQTQTKHKTKQQQNPKQPSSQLTSQPTNKRINQPSQNSNNNNNNESNKTTKQQSIERRAGDGGGGVVVAVVGGVGAGGTWVAVGGRSDITPRHNR